MLYGECWYFHVGRQSTCLDSDDKFWLTFCGMCSALLGSIMWACPTSPSPRSVWDLDSGLLMSSILKSLWSELGSDPCMWKPGWVQKILSNFIGSLSQTTSSLWSPHYFSISGASCFWPSSRKPMTSTTVPYLGTEKEGRQVKGFGFHLETTASGNRGCFPSLRSLPPGDPLASPVSVATTVGLLGSLGARQWRKERNGRFSTHLLSSRSSLSCSWDGTRGCLPELSDCTHSKFPAAKDEAQEIPERVNP